MTRALFDDINAHLAKLGLPMRAGTVVDVTHLAAPTLIQNEGKRRDPEMHQIQKGNQRRFGIKTHTGVIAESGLVHSVIGSAATCTEQFRVMAFAQLTWRESLRDIEAKLGEHVGLEPVDDRQWACTTASRSSGGCRSVT